MHLRPVAPRSLNGSLPSQNGARMNGSHCLHTGHRSGTSRTMNRTERTMKAFGEAVCERIASYLAQLSSALRNALGQLNLWRRSPHANWRAEPLDGSGTVPWEWHSGQDFPRTLSGRVSWTGSHFLDHSTRFEAQSTSHSIPSTKVIGLPLIRPGGLSIQITQI